MNIGILGLKGHHGVMLEGARRLGDCRIVAVSDENIGAVERFIENEHLAEGARGYHDWRHLIEHTMMDVACVCDENGLRAEQLKALAAREIHIVTEKPLATSIDDLVEVGTAIGRSKSRLTMLLTMRHEPKYATMRRLVQGGVIGPVALATSQKSYRLGERPQWQRWRDRLGGTIPYIGIHSADLIRWITGLDYTHVAAFHGRIGKPEMNETENHASLLLRMNNGASASVRLDYLRPMTAPTHGDDRIRFAGPEGVIESRQGESELLLITSDKAPHRVPVEPTKNLFEEFVAALRSGGPLPIPEEDCFYITDVMLRAREAADGTALIEIPAARAIKAGA